MSTITENENDRNPQELKRKKSKREKQITRKRIIIALVIILIAAAAATFIIRNKRQADLAESEVSPSNIGTVMRGDIQDELTASGSLEAGDTYTITSL